MPEGPAIRLNGYNFANQGIQGIWEGFLPSITDTAPGPSSSPQAGPLLDPLVVEGVQSISRSQSRRGQPRADMPSDFAAALLLLSAYHKPDTAARESADWKPTVSTAMLT